VEEEKKTEIRVKEPKLKPKNALDGKPEANILNSI